MTRFVKVQILLSEATMNRISEVVPLDSIEDRNEWAEAFDSKQQLIKDIGFDAFNDIKSQLDYAMKRLSA